MARIGFLGPHGTFTEQALLTQGDLAGAELVPVATIPEVLVATEKGEVDLGFVPIENSIEGTVNVALDTLAVDQPAAWQQVDELIATKKPREYDTAVQLLVDLRDLGERDGDTAAFQQRLTELRVVHARKPSLLERLDLAGLDA